MNREEFQTGLQELLQELSPEEISRTLEELDSLRSRAAGAKAEKAAEMVDMLATDNARQPETEVFCRLPEGKQRVVTLRLRGCTLPTPLTLSAAHRNYDLWLYKNGCAVPSNPPKDTRVKFSGRILPVLVYQQLGGKPLPAGTLLNIGEDWFSVMSESLALRTYPLSGEIGCFTAGIFDNRAILSYVLDGYYDSLLGNLRPVRKQRPSDETDSEPCPRSVPSGNVK